MISCSCFIFQVDHFTRYGLNEQLFEEDGKEDIMKKLKIAAEMQAEALRNVCRNLLFCQICNLFLEIVLCNLLFATCCCNRCQSSWAVI